MGFRFDNSLLPVVVLALLRILLVVVRFLRVLRKLGFWFRLSLLNIQFELEGIDFCMTALFVIIFIDQWEKSKNHIPALLGLTVALVSLYLFGSQRFMLVALLIVSGILLLVREKDGKEVHCE